MKALIINFFKFPKSKLIAKMPRELMFFGIADKWSETVTNAISLLFPFLLKYATSNLSAGNLTIAVLLLALFCLKKNIVTFTKSLTRNYFGRVFSQKRNIEVKIQAIDYIHKKGFKNDREKISVYVENYLSNIWQVKVAYAADLVSLIVTTYAIFEAVKSTHLSIAETIAFVFLGIISLYLSKQISSKNLSYYKKHRSYQADERKLILKALKNECTSNEFDQFKKDKKAKEENNISQYYSAKFFLKEFNNLLQIIFKIVYIIVFFSKNEISPQILTEIIADIAIFDAIFSSYKDISALLIERAEMMNVISAEEKNINNL